MSFPSSPAPGAAPPAPPGVTPAALPPAAPCVHPTNWSHGPAADDGPENIVVQLGWNSSTGSPADLKDCEIREVVKYDPIPNPPFLWDPLNPTIIKGPAARGVALDTHSYGLGLKTDITDPRVPGTMVAHQQYQFQCTGPGCSSSWEDFPNEAYTITRDVFTRFALTDPWRYRITKQGVSNSFNHSREVPIPDPPAPTPAPAPGPSVP